MKILVVEDEKKIMSFLKKGLQSEGHAVDSAFDGVEGVYKAVETTYDLIILDIRLPELDGISVCRQVRAKGISTPIIMLTARDTVEDRILGLDSGADDYLTKPFSFSELLARVRAIQRRQTGNFSSQLQIGDLILNSETLQVTRAGKEIKLSATEFKLLKFLMEHSHKVVSKPLILESVWGFDFSPESNIVEVYINYLRDKLDKGFEKPMIQTAHGMGYRLCD